MVTQASNRTENTAAYSSTTSSVSSPEVAGPTVEVGGSTVGSTVEVSGSTVGSTVEVGVTSGGTGMERMPCLGVRRICRHNNGNNRGRRALGIIWE